MATTIKNKDELTITRIFDAPRETRVESMDGARSVVKKWWGPQYFTAPVSKIDLRSGRASTSTACAVPTARTIGARAFIARSFRWSGSS